MIKVVLLLLTLLFSTRMLGQDIAEQVDRYLREPSKWGKFNGTILVAKQGEIILTKGYGLQNKEREIPNHSNTIFRVGSISKPITATAILYLFERKQLDLADPLSKYIPDFPNGTRITIADLLSHSSGIVDYLQVKRVQQLPDNAAPVSIDTLISYFKSEKPVASPGKKFSYSNSNYIVLAYIIEKITGEKFEQFVREKIFVPAGMNDSGFDFLHLPAARKATGYTDIRKNTAIIDFDSTYAIGCGSMYTTVSDLYNFYKALSNGRILMDSTRDIAFVPRFEKYGYGWFSYKLLGQQCISHAGGVPGFVADFHFFPADDICIIMLTNTTTGHVTNEKIAAMLLERKKFK